METNLSARSLALQQILNNSDPNGKHLKDGAVAKNSFNAFRLKFFSNRRLGSCGFKRITTGEGIKDIITAPKPAECRWCWSSAMKE